jgi:serine protease Do
MESLLLPKKNLARLGAALGHLGLALVLGGYVVPCHVYADAPAAGHSQQTGVLLDQKTLDLIQEATFEVVAKKPPKDSLTYERPLPLDLLPYSIRTDKYESVGTAFAIAPDRYVSAAHVLGLDAASQRKDMSLRDKDGNVYAIDKILKYSSRRDFVVFSIKHTALRRAFQPNTQPRLNEKVYAVGNALGQGVVIRDGLYTSSTPEDRDGAWKWIRFSAAASPGNSGGPLLDQDGKLIGIVEGKSENENLNFALPIAEVLNAKENLAVYDSKMGYGIDNMSMTKIDTFRQDISLPKSFDDLNRELIQAIDRQSIKLMNAMFQENRQDIFPNGKGSTDLLHTIRSSFFPGVIARGDNGVWDVYAPTKTNDAELGSNGNLTYGNLGNSTYFYLRVPDNTPVAGLTRNSKQLMDLFLKGIGYTRNIGMKKTIITSFGKAQEEYLFTDSYKRKWIVMNWSIEFSDQRASMMVLPVPGGFMGMLRIVRTGDLENHVRDMKALADFIYVSYYGTLRQWREYLAMKDLLPAVFSGIHIGFEYGKDFKYQSGRIAFSYPSSLMKIAENSDLQLGFSYFSDHGKVVWDVSKVVVGENKSNNTSFAVYRNTRPSREMDDKFRSAWEDLVNSRHPYNHSIYFDDNVTIIGTAVTKGINPQKVASVPVLYAAMYNADGAIDQKAAAAKLNAFVQAVDVRESGMTAAVDDGNVRAVAKR